MRNIILWYGISKIKEPLKIALELLPSAIFLLVIFLLVVSVSCIGIAEEYQSQAILYPDKQVIKIEAEGEILHYQKESFWDDEDFFKIQKSKQEFILRQISSFKESLKRYNRYVNNPEIEFDKSRNLTVLVCDIRGAKEGYWYDFDWFLRPLGLDFLDSNFERREKQLYWEGEVRGINSTISIKFPFPISNCHEHVWRR